MPPPRARRSCRDALRSTQIVGSLQAYSVNRLFAFHDYCQSVSRIRVILIVLFFCAPSIIVLTVLDSIPLQDPMEGWKANTTFWGRTRVNSLVVCSTILVQARTVVPEVQFTTKTIVGIAVSASAGYTAALMLIAKSWVFPVPFASTIGGLPFIIIMNILVVVALGTSGREQLKAYFRYSSNLGIQTTMVVVYPAYVAIFLSLHGYPQLAFVLVLPIIKISFKYIIAKMYQDDEDFVPSMVSSVDIFDALYMTKCMQSGGTLVIGFGIIAVDLVQSYVAIASLGRQTKKVREILAISRSGGEAFKGLLPWMFDLLESTRRSSIQAIDRGPKGRYTISIASQAATSRIQVAGAWQGKPRSLRKIAPLLLQSMNMRSVTRIQK